MSKLTIDTGPSTVETIKTGFDDCNANFTELYNRLGPYNGNKPANFELQLAIKTFQINAMAQAEQVYIGKLVAGAVSEGGYLYEYEIWSTSAFTGTGVKICSRTGTVANLLTGTQLVFIGQYNGSGRFAYVGINFDLLTAGTTYTASNYPEGAIFAVTNTVNSFNGTGETDGLIEEITTTATGIDGSKQLYWIDAPDGYDVTLEEYDKIVGTVNFKVTGTADDAVNIKVQATEPIDGQSDVYLVVTPAGGNVVFSLIPYDGGYLLDTSSAAVVITPNPA